MQVQTAENKKTFDATVWVERHGDYLFAFALSRVRDEFLAEDLVQETLLAAMQTRQNFQEKSSEKTWLCGILKHKIIDHFRKSCRETELTDEEADMSSYDYLFRDEGVWKGHWTTQARPIVWNENPEKCLEHTEFRGILSHCLGELPERVANCFTMREIDGFDSAEICMILGISPNNFWVMMHRARLHLRRCIDFNWFRKTK
ncbi:MAG TPA: sigma-70 family RNA polymerase sigma factor [Pyrinomonadaceae bacterium]|nr:sigma-70 family RNA polymerase sigma factor [Pyrinomonadaceae bacterium]